MNQYIAWFGGRMKVHGHATVVADANGSGLPAPSANPNDITRVILRPKGDITFTLDGSDPAGAAAMYSLKDEIAVLDTAWELIQVAGADITVYVIFLGA